MYNVVLHKILIIEYSVEKIILLIPYADLKIKLHFN